MFEFLIGPILIFVIMGIVFVLICYCMKKRKRNLMELQYHNYPQGTQAPPAVHAPQVHTAYPVATAVVGFDPTSAAQSQHMGVGAGMGVPAAAGYGPHVQAYPPMPTAPAMYPPSQSVGSNLPPSYDSVMNAK